MVRLDVCFFAPIFHFLAGSTVISPFFPWCWRTVLWVAGLGGGIPGHVFMCGGIFPSKEIKKVILRSSIASFCWSGSFTDQGRLLYRQDGYQSQSDGFISICKRPSISAERTSCVARALSREKAASVFVCASTPLSRYARSFLVTCGCNA